MRMPSLCTPTVNRFYKKSPHLCGLFHGNFQKQKPVAQKSLWRIRLGVSSLIATHLEQIVQGVYLGSVAYVVVAIHVCTLFPEGRDKAVQDLPCAL